MVSWVHFFLLFGFIRLSNGVVCPHCGKDFQVLSRHTWRCAARGTLTDLQVHTQPISQPPTSPPTVSPLLLAATRDSPPRASLATHKRRDGIPSPTPTTTRAQGLQCETADFNAPQDYTTSTSHGFLPKKGNSTLQDNTLAASAHVAAVANKAVGQSQFLICHCGRKCKGRRGLTSHQRRCRTMDALVGVDPSIDRSAYNPPLHSEPVAPPLCAPPLQRVYGLRLPRSDTDWNEANTFFLLNRPLPADLSDIDSCTASFQSSIYSYFSNEWGYHKPRQSMDVNKTTISRSIRYIRRELRGLKDTSAPTDCIQLASKALRKAYAVKLQFSKQHCNNNYVNSKDKYNSFPISSSYKYKINPWAFMKSYSENVNVDPTFDNAKGEAYFRNIYSEQHPNRVFQRPDWIPILPPPSLPFLHDCLTPSYNDISRIIRKMKSSSTPCPLDGISVIIFKRCPILRTHLARLLATCWEKGIFPKIWKKASVILIHKKGDPSDPQNFRPIALQPVLGKIFNSCIRNRLWHYFTNNNLIDLKIQKGFWPGIDGVTEHTELLQYLMHHQKIHKREFYIILLDLKNAFGEVHYSLIRFSLLHHHVPPQTADLIMSQYQAFHLNITAKNCTLQTGAIHVQRGVLQGDTLSPLLFNLVFNTLMTSISQPALHSHGVLWGGWLHKIFVDTICR